LKVENFGGTHRRAIGKIKPIPPLVTGCLYIFSIVGELPAVANG